MAFSGNSGRGQVRSEINITPLVDVVLVLLIIFMVLSPIMLKEMNLKVPEKVELQDQLPNAEQVVLQISAEGALSINHQPVLLEELGQRIRELLSRRREKVVFFDVDDAASYELAVKAMDSCRGGGAETLGIMTKPEAPKE